MNKITFLLLLFVTLFGSSMGARDIPTSSVRGLVTFEDVFRDIRTWVLSHKLGVFLPPEPHSSGLFLSLKQKSPSCFHPGSNKSAVFWIYFSFDIKHKFLEFYSFFEFTGFLEQFFFMKSAVCLLTNVLDDFCVPLLVCCTFNPTKLFGQYWVKGQ